MATDDLHDDPVDRLRAFLNVWLVPGRDVIERIHADRAYELRGSDIAAALKQLDDMQAERDKARAEADNVQWLMDQLIARGFVGTRELRAVVTERPTPEGIAP
jgi:hypothetical protein